MKKMYSTVELCTPSYFGAPSKKSSTIVIRSVKVFKLILENDKLDISWLQHNKKSKVITDVMYLL